MVGFRYRELTWEEVRQAAEQRRVPVVPVAAIEQHGPHLPVDVDNLTVEQVSERAGTLAPDLLLVLPPIHYGFNEHNMDFPGTISIRPEVFTAYAVDVGISLARQGFRRILYVNGHGSNVSLLNMVARTVTNTTPAWAAAMNHWDLAREVAADLRESPRPGGMDHACEYETSVYLHLRPEGVKTNRIANEMPPSLAPWLGLDLLGYGRAHFMPPSWSMVSNSGVTGMPSLATAEKGERLVTASAEELVRFARAFRDWELKPRQSRQYVPPGE